MMNVTDLGRFKPALLSAIRALEGRARDRAWRRFEPTEAALDGGDADALRELLGLLPFGDESYTLRPKRLIWTAD